MARVLVITELLPFPLVSGAKVRGYYVLRHLSARHQVTLLSFVRPDDRREDVAHLETFVDSVHTVPMRRSWPRNARAVLGSLITGQPAIIAREKIGAMHRKVEDLLSTAQFDVIHCDQIPTAQYGLLGSGRQARRILDQHNATFQIVDRLAQREPNGLKRALLQREARAFARYEMDICQRFDYVTFVSSEDRRLLLELMQHQRKNGQGESGPGLDEPLNGRTSVIPICVDTIAVPPVQPVPSPFRVTHIGTMYWPPNVEGLEWFWKGAWPEVQSELPDARLTLIGKKPPDHVRAWGQSERVDVLGYVEDPKPYLAETAVFVVPLHAAGGMRVKIVDAWCWGMPLVSTSVGAEGIAFKAGDNILIADTEDRFAQAVVQVFRDRELQSRLRSRGREWAEEQYDWHQVYQAWDAVYDRLTME
jgi:glycosyltransferase involved in cell wall biosynthesis